MKAKTTICGAAMIAALFGAVAHISMASGAEVPSSPEEQAATGKLNSSIVNCNMAADDRYRALEMQFQSQKLQNQDVIMQYQAQNEALQKQYETLRADYMALETQNQEQRKQNENLQQQYQDMLKAYQAIPSHS